MSGSLCAQLQTGSRIEQEQPEYSGRSERQQDVCLCGSRVGALPLSLKSSGLCAIRTKVLPAGFLFMKSGRGVELA